LITGDYILSHQDLISGFLALIRSYDSGMRYEKGPFGWGGTHNFIVTARSASDGFEGLGANSPISGAAATAARYVALDLLDTGSDPKPLDRLLAAIATEQWLVNNLTSNVVAVTQPGSIEHFTKLADGSYQPPLGSRVC